MTTLPAAPFLDLIGISPPSMEDGKAVTEVDLAPHHMNRLESAHGGVIATLLDTAMVGAAQEDIGASADQGAAYVFVRSGTTWSQQQKLTASGYQPLRK